MLDLNCEGELVIVPGREEFGRDDERGGVGAEVGEEESKRVERQKRNMATAAVLGGVGVAQLAAEVVVHEGENEHEERHEEEAQQLNDPPPHYVDERHREPVSRYRRAQCNQSLAHTSHPDHINIRFLVLDH